MASTEDGGGSSSLGGKATGSELTAKGDLVPAQLREDQVRNAVAFLMHPKVRESTTDAQKSFLEGKGLTPAEIAEAFSRVQNRGNQPSTNTTVSGQQVHPGGQQLVAGSPYTRRTSWTRALLGLGFIGVGVFAIKKYAMPWVNEWLKPQEGKKAGLSEQMDCLATRQQESMVAISKIDSELSNHTRTVEGLLQEMNRELRTLSSRIEMLALEARDGNPKREIQEVKFLLNGLADTPPRPELGTSSLWPPPTMEHTAVQLNAPPHAKPATPPLPPANGQVNGVQGNGIGSHGDERGYMDVLGLLANGDPGSQNEGVEDAREEASPDFGSAQSWRGSQNGSSKGPQDAPPIAEIQPEPPSVSSKDFDNGIGVRVSASDGWKPPPLPEPTLTSSAKQDTGDANVS